MEQINNQKKLQLYFFYLVLGGFMAAEPVSLKLFCETYLPGFYYRSLTVPMSVVLGIAAMKQWRIYRGYYPITARIILQQLKSKSFTQQCIAGISAIRQAVLSTRQAYIFLGLKFWEGTKFHYQFLGEVLVSILNWKRKLLTTRHQRTNRNSYSKKIATEPTALVWRNISYGYFLLAQLSQLLLIYIPVLFWQNVPRWGWFNTTLTFAWEAFLIFLLSFLSDQGLMNAIKRQQLANQSGEDLLELSESFQSLEVEGWQFKYRVILPENKNGFQWKKCNFKSLTSRLSNKQKKQRDIDVFAISPDGCNFVIDLKSHVGEVVWNSEQNTIYHRLVAESKPVSFKGGDLLDKIHAQAKRLKENKKLSQSPERILVFWRAEVRIPENKRIKRGVLISDKSRLVRDLKKRNRQLVRK